MIETVDVLRPDEALDEWKARGGVEFVETGIGPLDQCTGGGLPIGQVTVLTGYTGIGKSEVGRQISRRISTVHVDVELGVSRIVERHLAQEAQVAPSNLRFEGNPAVQHALEQFAKLPLRIIRPPGLLTPSELEGPIQWGLEDLGNGKLVILDSLQRLAQGVPENDQRIRVQNFVYWAAYFAEANRVAVLIMSEQKRPQSDGRGGTKTYTVDAAQSSSAESRAIEFTADVHLVMYPDAGSMERTAGESTAEGTRRVRLFVSKNRPGGEVGWLGEDLVFRKPYWEMATEKPTSIERLIESVLDDGDLWSVAAISREVGKGKPLVKKTLESMDGVEQISRGNRVVGWKCI